MSNGTGRSGSGPDTSRFTARRLKSAFFLWRAAVRGTDVLAAIFLVALSLGLGAYVFARARGASHLAFAQRAQLLQARVSEKLSSALENLSMLQSSIEASDRATRSQFRLLVYPMLVRNPYIHSFAWLPVVRESERLAYEAQVRASHLASYAIWERGPDGRPAPASPRAFHVPIYYMEPPSALALGFDITSDEMRWGTAGKARDRAEIVASPPFEPVGDAGKSQVAPAVAAYAPVYRPGDPGSPEARLTAIRGFAVAVFRVGPLVNKAASDVDASGLGLLLRDPDALKGPPLAERPLGAASLPRRPGFELSFPVQCASRTWHLDVFALPAAFLPQKRIALEAASAGILASLIGLITVTSLRTISRLRRQAEKVGPYHLVARLGHGAMGVVWEARHALLRRPTAVKLLAPGTEGERSLARFEREVQLTAGLTHPSTIAIYDYGRTADGVFYYAMELLRGINLLQLVAFDGPLAPGRVVHLLRQACGALSEAHAAGLIHRDIKPANLMICVYGGIPDFLKVLDFGLVKDVGVGERAPAPGAINDHGDAALSQDGSLLGTPLYMAPEGMTDPSGVDARADLFALGAVGYFLLTGHSPFPGQTAIEVFKKERQGPPTPLSEAARHAVPAGLDEAIQRCLAFDRADRPDSAETLDGMLQACRVEPSWGLAEARAWWGERGPGALATAAAERVEPEERGRFLMLSSDHRSRG